MYRWQKLQKIRRGRRRMITKSTAQGRRPWPLRDGRSGSRLPERSLWRPAWPPARLAAAATTLTATSASPRTADARPTRTPHATAAPEAWTRAPAGTTEALGAPTAAPAGWMAASAAWTAEAAEWTAESATAVPAAWTAVQE